MTGTRYVTTTYYFLAFSKIQTYNLKNLFIYLKIQRIRWTVTKTATDNLPSYISSHMNRIIMSAHIQLLYRGRHFIDRVISLQVFYFSVYAVPIIILLCVRPFNITNSCALNHVHWGGRNINFTLPESYQILSLLMIKFNRREYRHSRYIIVNVQIIFRWSTNNIIGRRISSNTYNYTMVTYLKKFLRILAKVKKILLSEYPSLYNKLSIN